MPAATRQTPAAPTRHLLIATMLPGNANTGVEMFIKNISRAARDQGVCVGVVSPYSRRPLLQRACNFLINQIARFNKELAAHWLRRTQQWRLTRNLQHQLARTEIRSLTIAAQDPLSAVVAARRTAGSSVRTVATVHFNVSESFEYCGKGVTTPGSALCRALQATERSMCETVQQVVCVSSYTEQQLHQRQRSFRNPPQVIYNFLSSVPPAGDRTSDAITIGSLESRKNHRFLLRVIAHCQMLGYPYRLTVVGDGELRAALEVLANDLNITSLVTFTGAIADAARLIPEHRVLLHGADMESFGIVLLEAMASGTPSFAQPVGGIPEVISDNVEGCYWHAADVAAAACRLIEVLESPACYARLADNARRSYQRRFHPQAIADRWMQVLFPAQPAQALAQGKD
ncbi:MAG: glycosyltransferase family 4 protein [Pseudomonadota bacterium]